MLHRRYARLFHLVQISIAVFFPFIFLSACTFQGPFVQPTAETERSAQESLLLKKVGQLKQGDTIKLDDPAYGGTLKATVLDSYYSAAAVDCKRLLVETTSASWQLLVCRDPQGSGWSAVPQSNN
nr:DVU3141 family protein [uncultured Desulfobulbus sp.]